VTKNHLATWAAILAIGAAFGAVGRAQEKAEQPTAAQNLKVTPVRLQIVLTRMQAERKISSMPYTLSVNVIDKPYGSANLRMGAKIPINMLSAPSQTPGVGPVGPVQYQDVGTNIDSKVYPMEDGRFRVEVLIDDSSVYPDESGKTQQPSFRTFRATNAMILKDGQTGQFTSATDKVSGEVTKVDVTLTVLK